MDVRMGSSLTTRVNLSRAALGPCYPQPIQGSYPSFPSTFLFFFHPGTLKWRRTDSFRIGNLRKRENYLIETVQQSWARDTRRSQRSPVKTVTTEPVLSATSLFHVSLAQTPDDLVECQRLRYLVFNLELKEGLSTSERG